MLRPAIALAQTSPEVKAYFLSIAALYDALEYESALAQIAKARAITKAPADNATLSLYEGVILADMNRREASDAAFRKALLAQPDAKLPMTVSPKVAQRFEQLRETVKQEQLAARPKTPAPPTPPKDAPQVNQGGTRTTPDSSLTSRSGDAPVGVSGRSFTRPQVLVPAIAGGVLMVLGGTSYAMSRKELSNLNNDDPKLATREDAERAADRGRTFQSVGVGLLGAGAAGLGFALGWYAFGPTSSGETALTVGTDGTSAFVQGRWP
ncbi:tetratricopeptide repeat protein [Hyalangium gracile]|uniref:tetratricopeptide repeat protein n=1 Tax=Hyalangium gracile TaxID=394092 RepID=UPI001CCB80F8|nr:tetratricopeptide repeat protein [Hyalangium gracile]